MPACVRHPDRPTGLRCTRCDRPACPECLREASVGYQCVDCVNEGRVTTRRARTVAGAEHSNRLVVTPLLILLNVVVFGVTVYQAQDLAQNQNSELFADWYLSPGMVAFGEWWRLFTAGFLHYGPIHIALNMMGLYVLGRELEPEFGRLRFIAVYFVSLLGGSVAVMLLGDMNPATAGASGAVFGLMGGFAVLLIRRRMNAAPAIGLIAFNVYLSFVIPGISILGHIGGLVTGAIATGALLYAPRQQQNVWQASALLGLAVALIGLVLLRDAQYGELACEARFGCVRLP
jgi:membrane associated rhomboid family serine protease